jgi:hypothetical protein
MKYDPVYESHKIFSDSIKNINWDKTTSLIEAADFLNELVNKTTGLLIIDYLDSGNWDSLASVEKVDQKGYLILNWRDYRDTEEDRKLKEIKKFFPANLNSTIIKFKELRILKTKNYPVFLIRGFSIKDKEIRKYLSKNSKDFELTDNEDNFSKTFYREFDDHLEKFKILNTPIFSMLILPKNSSLNSFDSKSLLFDYNLNDCLKRIEKVENSLNNENIDDEDFICEKANTIRRILENVLKIELCYRFRQVNVKKGYSDLKLGDLIKHLKPHKEEYMLEYLTTMIIWSNELSHDSGIPIIRAKALLLSKYAHLYTNILINDIIINPHPGSSF